MMKVRIFAAVVVVAMGLAAPAFAGGTHCDEDIAAVDKALATAKLGEADMAKVKAARASAEEMRAAKKDDECEKALGEAQALLGIKHEHEH